MKNLKLILLYLIAAIVSSGLMWWVFATGGHLLDRYVITMVNKYSTQNETINKALFRASELDILTGGLLMCMIWYIWFNDNRHNARERLLLEIAAVLLSAVVGPLLQLLSTRLRPLHDPASGFLPLPGIDPTLLSNWGSFPSDHAVVFFALFTLIWRRSRWLGMLALVSALYGTLFRIYVGAHYLSDIIGGGLIGVAIVDLSDRVVPRTFARYGIAWEMRQPALFYSAAFLISFELATLFADIRMAARSAPAVLEQLGVSPGVLSG